PGPPPGLPRGAAVIAAPGEERDQAHVRHLGPQACEAPSPIRRDLERADALVLVEAGQGLLDRLAGDALRRERACDGPPPAPSDRQVMFGELSREGPVVEQPDLLESVEPRRHLGRLEPRLAQPRLELAPRPRTDREQPKRALVAVQRLLAGALGRHVRTPGASGPSPNPLV